MLENTGDLIQKAEAMRQRIIDVMAVNGGHLASNLGSIEFLLALHAVFDSPTDKLIFDVSHQAYPHKLLTGRDDARFDQIRRTGGLSGFTHPKESPHDHFFAGHAGTAISLGLGMAKSRDLQAESHHVIPIIGDATLTCGLSLEALNNIQQDLSRFIVVLNDNAMSISRNVGGITNLLSRMMSNPTTSKWSHELTSLLGKIPKCGTALAKQGKRLQESIKNLVSSAPFFEHFGLSYIGPVDGHDVHKLVPLFAAIKDLPMPVLVHLYTQKGHGLEKAEKDPTTFHGVKPFDPKTCEFLPTPASKPTFPKIYGKHLLAMAEQDERIVAITPATSRGSCLDPFMDRFPKRSFDVGIAEGHAVTFAGGLAKEGKLTVFCTIYSTFLHRALDNLFHDVCLQEIPVIFGIDRAGIAFGDGATHHGIYDISFLRAMPNLVICQPRNGQVLKELMSAAPGWNLPVAIRYPNLSTDVSDAPLQLRDIGKAEVLAEGGDLLILALGHQCAIALEVRTALASEGIEATVVDPVFIKPLDADLLSRLMLSHSRVVTLEEHTLKGGLGSEVDEFLLSHGFSAEVLNLGIPDRYFEHGKHLLDELELTPAKITQRILAHFSFAPVCETV